MLSLSPTPLRYSSHPYPPNSMLLLADSSESKQENNKAHKNTIRKHHIQAKDE